MITAGIDLAAEPKGTALALIEWSEDQAKLVYLEVGLADPEIIEVTSGVDKIGIDCALGWPIEFIEFLNRQLTLNAETSDVSGDLAWRRRIAYRETDRFVREETGRWPLSVATDRLGMTAMRAAGLLSKYGKGGIEIDRSGQGLVVEVYPGASLRVWGFDTSGYRSSEAKRIELINQLRQRAPWLELGANISEMSKSCDAFDSVFAALSARAAALGHCKTPPVHLTETSRIEGWVALPNRQLRDLV